MIIRPCFSGEDVAETFEVLKEEAAVCVANGH